MDELYCKTVGNVISPPTYLPTGYGNVTHFHVAKEEIKNANGWYKYIPAEIPSYDPNTQLLVREYVRVGNYITDLYSITNIGLDDLYNTIENAKTSLYQKIANKRWLKESAGYRYKNNTFKTDEYSQSKILAAYVIAKDDPNYTVNWKTENAYVLLNAQDILNLFSGIRDLIQELFLKESIFRSEVSKLNDIKALNQYTFDFDVPISKLMVMDASIDITSNKLPSFYGETVSIIARVIGVNSVTPTGSVEFYNQTADISLGTFALLDGGAVLNTSTLPVGVNFLQIRYSGDSSYNNCNAEFIQSVNSSVYALKSSPSAPMPTGSLALSNSSKIEIAGKVCVNSPNNPALTMTNTSKIKAGSVNVVGVISNKSSNAIVPTPQIGANQGVLNPLAGLPTPVVKGTATSVNLTSGSMTIEPGIYSQIKVSNTANIILKPGIYILAGGGLSVSGAASISGDEVFFFNTNSTYPGPINLFDPIGTYGTININTSGVVNLSAIKTGLYAGILIYQSIKNVLGITLKYTSGLVQGVIYSNSGTLVLSGGTLKNSSVLTSSIIMSSTAQILGDNYVITPSVAESPEEVINFEDDNPL